MAATRLRRSRTNIAARRLADPAGRAARLAGAAASLGIAIALFTRFGVDDHLSRDEAVYAYGGQQLADGVPPYVSVFDSKTPLATIVAGLAALAARAAGADELHGIRLAFLACACLAVVAVYALGLGLWDSPAAGIVAAVVLASFGGFAMDAAGGPDAKTPGVLLGALAMALLARRRWFWGACAGSLAFLVWQPLGVYAALAVAVAGVASPAGTRRASALRALCGAAIPLAAITAYFVLAGAVPELVVAALRFPLTGLRHGDATPLERARHIADVVDRDYARTRILFWGGLASMLFLAALRFRRRGGGQRGWLQDPYLTVVVPSFAALAAMSLRDFQGYPDLYPLLPYAAIGVGGVVAVATSHIRGRGLQPAAIAVCLGATAALVVASWSWYSAPGHARRARLSDQRAWASAIERIVDPGETLYALGDPTPLVLTGRRNPSRYIYLGSGVAPWVVRDTPGGFAGWTARIRAAAPPIIVVNGWTNRYARRMRAWLRSTYDAGSIGRWRVFVAPGIRRRARRRGVALTRGRLVVAPRAPRIAARRCGTGGGRDSGGCGRPAARSAYACPSARRPAAMTSYAAPVATA